ncbi:ComE operon protein 1 [Polystyrenella longa]|uniref:ComE operon protein 1 n=1 Tax=Polystyrenella longa TaxID=2528007 RepID=A0A518CS57_9PLAN|nr:helix-hairpin-helix domain-containing protein [Polystyrenella longa]QDU82052.1 ComE operon protein 1 [Polystyrenella longa]
MLLATVNDQLRTPRDPDSPAIESPEESTISPASALPRLEAAEEEKNVPFTKTQQLLVILVMGSLVLMLGLHWARLQGWGLESVEIDRPAENLFDYQLEINSASWVEWIQLPGIGKPTAEKIIADREQNGPFQSVDDLIRVNGIGEIKLDQIRPWLRIELDSDGKPAQSNKRIEAAASED